MKTVQITAVTISIAIFAAAVLFSHFATNAAESKDDPQPQDLTPVQPVIKIQHSENAVRLKNHTEKTEDNPGNDLSLLHKYQNVGTMGQALSKDEFDSIQKNGNKKPPEDDQPRENPFDPRD